MDLIKCITNSTLEIFNTMLMFEVSPGTPLVRRNESFRNTISGMIGMAGVYKGVLAVHAPNPVAMAITGALLGMEVPEINEDVKDAIGEIANMLAGNVKGSLSANSQDIKLSIPSTICGGEYRMDCHPDGEAVIIPFTVADGEFLVELYIQQQLSNPTEENGPG